MHMSSEGLLVILLVGIAAGWLAGQLVDGTGFGIVGDLIIGIIGAFIGDWLVPRLGLHLGAGIIAAIANATIGAIVLLLIHQARSRGRRAGRLGRLEPPLALAVGSRSAVQPEDAACPRYTRYRSRIEPPSTVATAIEGCDRPHLQFETTADPRARASWTNWELGRARNSRRRIPLVSLQCDDGHWVFGGGSRRDDAGYLHPAATLPRHHRDRFAAAPRHLSSRDPERGRRVAALPRRRTRSQRLGHRLFRAEGGRRPGRYPTHAARRARRSLRAAAPPGERLRAHHPLALFGEVPWRAVPVMPVEIMLLPRWFPFHISTRSRTGRAPFSFRPWC